MLNIITNTASMAASRSLNRNQKALAQSFQRLSTGLRINSAKDDAAGNAIANRLTSQFRGLNQAARNANDSISMLQTADSAVAEQQTMLQRLRELAVQSASDTNTATDRAAIQAEANALVSEIDRIASQTTFNGRELIDGSLSDVKFQVGAFQSETVSLTLKGSRTYNLGAMYSTTTSAVDTDALAAGNVTLNGFAVRAATSDDDPFSSSLDTASAIAAAAAINAGTADHNVTAEANAAVTTAAAAVTASTITAGTVSINGVDIGAVTVLANDSDGALQDAINSVSAATGVTASLSDTNAMVLTADDGRNVVVVGANTGVAAATYTGTLTLKSEDEIVVGGADADNIGLGLGTMSNLQSTNVSTLDFSGQTSSQTAIEVIDDAIGQLNGRQAEVGALLNRMENAVSSLSAAAENIAAARGQIQDADFAAETAAFSKNQILQQASASMLAQANVQGQLALSLLG